ncbi:MAG: hypothetical protein QM482_03765 [Sulfurospirillum sp.]
MSKEIVLSYRWTKEIYMQAGEFAYDFKMNHTPKKYMGWFFIALLQFGVVGALLKGTLAILLFSTILLIYWYYIKKRIEKSLLLKNFDREEDANKILDIIINKEHISINNKKILWSDITQIISGERGYLLDHIDGFLFFPANAFKKEEDKTEFIEFAKKNGIHIQRIQKSTNQPLIKTT